MNKIQLKTGQTSEKTQDLLGSSVPRELIFDASSGFIWIKDPAGNRLRVAGPRATASFWFKGIVTEAITTYPGSICDVGDALFLQVTSTVDGVEIPAGSLIVKVADTEDGIGSWYNFDKVTQSSLKISSSLISATNLIDALEEIRVKILDLDGVNIIEKDDKICLSKDVSVWTMSATGDETGQRRESCARIGSVTPEKRVVLLFKKNISDVRAYFNGEVFEYGASGMSHTRLSVSSIGSKSFSSVSSSPNGRVRLITCTHAGSVWLALRFPPSQSSAVYFSGWRNVPEDMAPPASYLDADVTGIETMTIDSGEGFTVFDGETKRGMEIDDSFYVKVPVSADPLGFKGPPIGSVYYDSELGMHMIFQGTRWESTLFNAAFGAKSVDGQYLGFQGVQANGIGFPIARNAIVKSISVIANAGDATKGFEIRKNGSQTALYSFYLNNLAFTATGLAIPFSASDIVQVFATNTGNKTTNVVAVLELAYIK